jgi:pilus assembly protein CpaF
VNAIIPPLSLVGPVITIRKFSASPFTVDDLIRFGTATPDMFEFLRAAVEARLNVFVSGGTGSGKTTTLNVLSSFIPNDERIVTIEDAAELQLRQEHVVTLESRPPNIEGKGQIPIRELVRNSLRMRPDRIIVGECRAGEALDMLQAMNTGHDGSMSTGHANSPRDMLARLETMVLMAGVDLPVRAIREQIASAVDLIVHQARLKDGTRRITNITEVQGMEGDVIVMQDVFVFEQTGVVDGKIQGRLKPTGIRPKFVEKFEVQGIHLPPGLFMGNY